MIMEHKVTLEENAFGNLLGEMRGDVTEDARELVGIAQDCACAFHPRRNYAFQPEEFYIADHNMLHLAYALTEHDREVLAEIVQAAKAASDSLDKDDHETPAGFRFYVADLHHYYPMISEMVGTALKPTTQREINSAQFELWREYGELLKAEADSARPCFDESHEDVPF